MNKLQLLAAVEKKAYTFKHECINLHERAGKTITKDEAEFFYNQKIDSEFARLERVMLLVPRLDALLVKHNIATPLEKLTENLLWITIRPSTEHKDRFLEFKKYCEEKYFTRQMFLSITYVFEQKGENIETLGHGYHCHILAHLTPNVQKHHCLRNTKSTFTKFLKGECPDAFVEIKKVDTVLYKANLLHYISGLKSDIDKFKAVEMDKLFREKYNLETFYSNDASFQDQLRGIKLDM